MLLSATSFYFILFFIFLYASHLLEKLEAEESQEESDHDVVGDGRQDVVQDSPDRGAEQSARNDNHGDVVVDEAGVVGWMSSEDEGDEVVEGSADN